MNKRYFGSLIMGVLLAIIFFGCRKEEKSHPIICYFGPPPCIAVKYVATGATAASNCQDIIQIVDPPFISAYSAWMDTLQLPGKNADGSFDNQVKVPVPNVMSITPIPAEFKDGQTFYIRFEGLDSTKMQPAICIFTRFTAKFTEIGHTTCAPSGPKAL